MGVKVETASNCTWTVKSNVAWVKGFIYDPINYGTRKYSSKGNGYAYYNVEINRSVRKRIGTLTIAGQTFTITQEGMGEK